MEVEISVSYGGIASDNRAVLALGGRQTGSETQMEWNVFSFYALNELLRGWIQMMQNLFSFFCVSR